MIYKKKSEKYLDQNYVNIYLNLKCTHAEEEVSKRHTSDGETFLLLGFSIK